MKNLNDLIFGTAGIPLSTKPRNTVEGVHEVKKLGLGAMELEFVQNINVSGELAPKVKEASEKASVVLTCHGQYFINLNSLEKEKIEASKQRIYNAAKRAYECGGWSMCFHPGFYQGQNEVESYERVLGSLKEVTKKLVGNGVQIWVRPETTGKPTQFGSIEEIIRLSQEIENVLPCVDFSHIVSRSNGKLNSFEAFSNTLEKIEKGLGKTALKNMHIHAQGVEFSEKGEKRHLPFTESVFDYNGFLKALKEYSVKGVVICESPLMESDTLFLAKQFSKT